MSRRLHFLLLGLGVLGAGCAAFTLTFMRSGGPLNLDVTVVAALVALGSLWIVAGLVGWWKRPENRTGALMTAAGFLLFTYPLFGWEAAVPFTLFGIVDRLFLAVVVYVFVAFPRGRLSTTVDRVLVGLVYADALLVAGVGAQLVRGPDPYSTEPRNLLLVHDDRGLANGLELAADLTLAALSVVAIALLAHRWHRASGPARRVLAPVLWSGVLVLILAAAALTRWWSIEDTSGAALLWAFFAACGAVPVAFLVGLLRTRLHRSVVADLVVELGSLVPPAEVRDAIARTLDDPSLELAFWVPEDEHYVDVEGNRVNPEDEPGRAVTALDYDGRRVAAFVHDPSLLDDPELIRAVRAAASLALENARLQAELRAQLVEVRASRARIVEAGDAERRRLERDLHDGAQQRLLGIRLALQLARGQAGDERAVEELLTEADAEVVGALTELRALARGIHPAILTEDGLAPALAALARRAPVPVEVTVCRERLPAAVEATAYFVAAEALANVVKHAHASRVILAVTRANGRVAVEVTDDGVGDADAGGPGLRGLRDRVEALDGRLRVESPSDGGTRVTAAIPCG